MKALIILGIILAALVLLSLVRLGALVEYNTSGLVLWAKLGPLRLTVLPRKPKKNKAGKQKKTKKEKKKPDKKQKEGETEKGVLALVKQFLPLVGDAAGRVKRKIRIDTFYLDFTAAASDPAMAALAFGGANAAVGMIWPIIEQNFNVKDWRIRTDVNFEAKAPVIWFQVAFTLTIGQAGSLGIHLAVAFLRLFAENKKAKPEQTAKHTNQSKKEAV